jgi:ABC-2 type transport system permease protein
VKQALRAEWSKTWSDRGTSWLLAGLVVATVAVSLATIAASSGGDPAKLSLTGLYLGQVIAAVAGVLAIGGEYGTGMIRVSLTAIPRRLELLAAKALVLAGTVAVASAVAVGTCLLAGWLSLPGHWFGPADWRAAFCSAGYLTLIAVLSLGVTAVVRDSAVAAGVVLGLLFLFPILITAVSDHTLVRHLEQISPLLAGQDLQATTGLSSLPLAPWPALGVVALWAAAALTAGGLALCGRDA